MANEGLDVKDIQVFLNVTDSNAKDAKTIPERLLVLTKKRMKLIF